MKNNIELSIEQLQARVARLESRRNDQPIGFYNPNVCQLADQEPVYLLTASQLAEFANAFVGRALGAAESVVCEYICDHGEDFIELAVEKHIGTGFEVVTTMRNTSFCHGISSQIQAVAESLDRAEIAVEVQDVVDMLGFDVVERSGAEHPRACEC